MLGLFRNKRVTVGEIKFFSLSYSFGCMVNSNASYQLKWQDGGYVASVKPVNEPDENAKSIPVPDAFARGLENILKAHRVDKWNGFQKYDKLICDGKSFTLSVIFQDKSSLNARGYVRWPKGYGEVKKEIVALFETVLLSE